MHLRFISFIFFIIYNSSLAQNNSTDSLFSIQESNDYFANIYNKAHFYSNTNIDSLLHYSNKMLKSKDFCTRVNGKINIATSFYKYGDFNQSEIITLDALNDLEDKISECSIKNKFNALGRLFWIYKNQGKFKEAFDVLTKQIGLIENSNENDDYYQMLKTSYNSNLAQLKFDFGFEKEAINIIKNVINNFSLISFDESDITKNYTLNIHKISSYNVLGDFYFRLNSKENNIHYLDSTVVFYNKAYQLVKDLKPTHSNSKLLYNIRMAKVKIKREEYDSALKLVSINDEKDINSEQDIYFLKSTIYKKLGSIDSSIHYAKKFLNFKKIAPSTEKNKIIIYNNLSELYDSKNIIDSAYKYSLLAHKKLDKIYKNKNEAYNNQLLVLEKRLRKINLSNLKQEQPKRNQLIIASFCILVVLLLFYFSYRQNQKSKTIKNIFIQDKKTSQPKKKQKYINKELEEKLLEKLLVFEKSTLFLDHKFNIQILAKKLKTNTSYLSYIINEKKGRTFKQYTTELRINYLLREIDNNLQLRKYTIKALGKEIGYTDASAFTRAFKNFTGKSPSEYISSLKN